MGLLSRLFNKKKFVLLKDDPLVLSDGTILYQVMATMNFGSVKKGERGGRVELEENLSQEGDCWIYPGAWVCGKNTRIFGNAQVDRVHICGKGHIEICGNAQVYGQMNAAMDQPISKIHADRGQICIIRDSAFVFGRFDIYGSTTIGGFAEINAPWNEEAETIIYASTVDGFSEINDRVEISRSRLKGMVIVRGGHIINSTVSGFVNLENQSICDCSVSGFPTPIVQFDRPAGS